MVCLNYEDRGNTKVYQEKLESFSMPDNQQPDLPSKKQNAARQHMSNGLPTAFSCVYDIQPVSERCLAQSVKLSCGKSPSTPYAQKGNGSDMVLSKATSFTVGRHPCNMLFLTPKIPEADEITYTKQSIEIKPTAVNLAAGGKITTEQIHEADLEAMDSMTVASLLLSVEHTRKWSVTTVISWDNFVGSAETKKRTSSDKHGSNGIFRLRVEAQLITYRKNEVLFSEEVAVLKREVACKDYEINVFKSKFEKVKQEKDGIDFKIEKFDKASKDLDQLLGSQITDKSKKGLGYNVVPPPHPLIYNRPKKLDLPYSGLDEFKEPEFKGYGPKNSKQESNEVCDKKSDNSKENYDESLVEEQVSQDRSSFVESSVNVDKETVFLVNKKVEFTKPENHEKPVKKSVRPKAVNTARSYTGQVNVVRVKGVNVIKSSACWVWRPTKPNGASLAFKRHNYIDAQGRSKSVMAWVPKGI
ncbi:hypothetical protein Tco_0430921 [Tanacetum coccineum]